MSDHQPVSPPPSSQLPVLARRHLHQLWSPTLPELPHTRTATLTQAQYAGVVNVSFTQPAENKRRCDYTNVFTQKHANRSLALCQSASHLPDQASGGNSRAARMDFPLRGLTPTKEKKAVFVSSSETSFIFSTFSSSSRELRKWCCSRTNNTPCAQWPTGVISPRVAATQSPYYGWLLTQ